MKYDLTENTQEKKTKKSLVDFSRHWQGYANIIKWKAPAPSQRRSQQLTHHNSFEEELFKK